MSEITSSQYAQTALGIGVLYRRACQSHRDSLSDLIGCGDELLRMKASLPHGDWLLWVKSHQESLGFTDSTARRLMAVARRYPSYQALAPDMTAESLVQISRQIWSHEGAVAISDSPPMPARRLDSFADWAKSHPPAELSRQLSITDAGALRANIRAVRAWLDEFEGLVLQPLALKESA